VLAAETTRAAPGAATMSKETRTCRCGCGLTFEVSTKSKRIYFSKRHCDLAKDYRRKLKQSGVNIEMAGLHQK
jgi:hypothetical protein